MHYGKKIINWFCKNKFILFLFHYKLDLINQKYSLINLDLFFGNRFLSSCEYDFVATVKKEIDLFFSQRKLEKLVYF